MSVVVGLLFWPRGAGAELARSLGDAYATAAAWLRRPLWTGSRRRRCGRRARMDPEALAALASARRLDDAYRQYLGERGAK